MGCCASKRQKNNSGLFQGNTLPELSLSAEASDLSIKTLKISITEVKFTKMLEKITSFPCNVYASLSNSCYTSEIEVGDAWGYVNTYKKSKDAVITLPESCEEVYLSVYSYINSVKLEIGSTTLDICAFDMSFKGIIKLYYRCLYSVFITCEVQLGVEPEEDLSLSFSYPVLDPLKSRYFPSREYPIDTKKYFTPNFCADLPGPKTEESKEADYSLIDCIKSSKTSYGELLEYLGSPHPAVIFYTLDRLKYFASQSGYASKLLQESKKFQSILKAYSQDKLIVTKCLWVVFELIKSFPENSNQAAAFFDKDFVDTIISVYHDEQISSLVVEILLKCLYTNKKTNIQTSRQIVNLCVVYTGSYKFAQIQAGVISLLFHMIQDANSEESIELIFTPNLFFIVIQSLKSYAYNAEIAANSLKVFKLYLTYYKFRKLVLETLGLKYLAPISKHYTDSSTQKQLINIVKAFIDAPASLKITKDMHNILVNILKSSTDTVKVTESCIDILGRIAKNEPGELVNEEMIEVYCDLFICFKGEIKLEMQLLELFKRIKDAGPIENLRKNKKIVACVSELLERYRIASTGSQSSKETICLRLKVLAEELLGQSIV